MNVSRIGLGTVELGIPDYAVGQRGLASEQDAITLLREAAEMGITYFDTARGYGVAEERIGKSGIGEMPGVIIGTKCGQFLRNTPELRGNELEKKIREEIDRSRTNLRQETLQLVQFHNELEDYTDYREIIEIFQKLKDEQKILHTGAAVRGEASAIAALNTDFFETIQLAYNIADQRMAPRVLPLAQEKNITVLNRSVLLKGSLTPARTSLPTSLTPLKEAANQAEVIAQELGIGLPELAMRFALSHPVQATILIGTMKTQHLASALAASRAEALPENILEKLRELALEDVSQIDPAKWSK